MKFLTGLIFIALLAPIGCSSQVVYFPESCVSESALSHNARLTADAPSRPEEVKVFKGTPKRPFFKIGVFQNSRMGEAPRATKDLVMEMRKHALRAGAHGLANVRTREVTYWNTEDTSSEPKTIAQTWEVRADAVVFIPEDRTLSLMKANCEPSPSDW